MNSNEPQPLKLVETKDGSQTILNEALSSTYHSRHGALTESEHVFIDKGLRTQLSRGKKEVFILEMGFGTGLNALLTEKELQGSDVKVDYHTLELFPLPEEVWKDYQLPAELNSSREVFEKFHQVEWNRSVAIRDGFSLTKHQVSLLDFEPTVGFDLVYFDAFEPETQPELWTQEVFERIFSWMNPEGILTTYCCKGYVRRNMLAAGFQVEKVPGPPGKREMIVATKPFNVK
ncbi:MAG: tRNA (5-methylaminomethyl-2-thiouridine)(34)-methyltransferase MnmD [Flavobacteriales bacterium]|nr:tRNA (5-methylaminomethyl-2-thiouridine)(34)-methyltransferase MnmD [Flavobacteriales bacterium]